MDKVVVVTGAGSGIGRATAHSLMERGHAVALIGRRADALRDTAQDKEHAYVFPCDISNPTDVDETFADIASRLGRIDALFNNAGTNVAPGTPDEISAEDWISVISVNLTGAFFCARAAFAQMRAQDPQGGRIVNNGSVSAYVPRPGSAPYTASKHGITGLTRSIALDGRPFNIACGQIDIGNALTDMAERMTRGVPQANGTTAVEPVMDARDVAEAVANMIDLPLSANTLFQTIMATNMPYVGRG